MEGTYAWGIAGALQPVPDLEHGRFRNFGFKRRDSCLHDSPPVGEFVGFFEIRVAKRVCHRAALDYP